MNTIGRSASQRCSAVSVLSFSPRSGCSICMTAAHAGKLSKFQWVDQWSFGAPIAKCHSSNCCFFSGFNDILVLYHTSSIINICIPYDHINLSF
jgi:hypothetical protein